MKTTRHKTFWTLIIKNVIIVYLTACTPLPDQGSMSGFTRNNNLYRPLKASPAEDSTAVVIYKRKDAEVKRPSPQLNIMVSYIFLNAKPDKSGEKGMAKRQKTVRQDLFVRFIQSVF